MTKSKFKDFNVKSVKLEGANLVEAGAGTGKTYSIAILVLRLLLEKKYSLKEILMVTFTKAATAELESRIREFVRLAYNHCCESIIEDEVIKEIVNHYNDKEKAKEILGKALLELDETSIFTIHSFCQNTLIEFAFETGQIFGAEGLEDLSEIIHDQVNEYWRKEVSKIDADLLAILRACKFKVNRDWFKYLTRDRIITVINNAISGKEFSAKTLNISTFAEYKNVEAALDNKITELINKNKKAYITRINNHTGNRYTDNAKEKLKERLNDPLEFAKHILKTTAENDNLIFAIEKEIFREAKSEKDSLPISIINSVFKKAGDDIGPRIKSELKEKKQISFDDMIHSLHSAIGNTQLKSLLQKRYRAVFIDEFQDTDKFQYDIFETLFGSNCILFYIGDPKQAIYAWRKADINTYFAAREGVNECYNMQVNFRSSVKMVDAFNKFFSAEGEFDPFCNESNDPEKIIEYTNVSANSIKTQKDVKINDIVLDPIQVYTKLKDESEINSAVCDTVCALLTKGKLGDENIKPSNIAILVRTNREAQGLKSILETNGIPAIVMSDEKIFSSPEAKYMLYFLEAINKISIKSIAKALLCSLTGFNSERILNLDPDVNVSFFKSYFDVLKTDGIYSCVSRFVADYKIKEHLLSKSVNGGQRKLSNFLQLSEVLQTVQKKKELDEVELLSFLKKTMGGMKTDGDNYVQRIESDNDALTIITIHKSKGLEYDIILVPFLDMTVKLKGAFTSYRHDLRNAYEYTTNININPSHAAYFETQAKQENSRLIYVAITRAKYQCFIYKSDSESALSPYITALGKKSDVDGLVSVNEYVNYNEQYEPKPIIYSYNYPVVNNFELKDKNWSKMSYSALSGEHKTSPKLSSKAYATKYDEFIFAELERGTNAGDLLHSIFEWIDFTDSQNWIGVIEKSLSRYLPKKSEFKEPLNEFLKVILNTEISISGGEKITLNKISNAQKCNELEFDLNLNEFQVSKLADLSNDTIDIHTSNAGKLYGILNGLMDLFFEYNGKYYILDWKSNYLGDDLNDYATDKLDDVMNENNYHLQYLIYTYAAKRFLEFKIQDFDYEKHFGGVIYLFLRGVREGSDTGFFTTIPSLAEINALDAILSGK
jgi:exodeoxyribonuclease V beta subunit